MKLIFLCSGNTSRSPMAEALFKRMVKGIDISSAGFSTPSHERASDNAIIVCAKHGIDLSDFETTNIADVDFSEVDMALTATVSARDKILRLHPGLEAYTIRQYSGGYEDWDIKDPREESRGDHVVCFFEIKEALERIVEKYPKFRNDE
jgi:protein-tyrosine phosphatase